MIGFGAMDNFVMIQAGQYIDSTLGVQLGLATMTAAAAGTLAVVRNSVLVIDSADVISHLLTFLRTCCVCVSDCVVWL